MESLDPVVKYVDRAPPHDSAAWHNHRVSVRITIDVPDDLYEALRRRAVNQRSINALLIGAIEGKFRRKQRTPVVEPPVAGTGKPGPLCPEKENPYNLLI